MTKNLFARLLAAASILAGCTQLPQSSGAPATTQARYVEAAASLGVPQQDLFTTVDLYESRNLASVVRSIHSLGRVTQRMEGWDGPTLGARLSTVAPRHFTSEQMARAKAAPNRWNNRGRAGVSLAC